MTCRPILSVPTHHLHFRLPPELRRNGDDDTQCLEVRDNTPLSEVQQALCENHVAFPGLSGDDLVVTFPSQYDNGFSYSNGNDHERQKLQMSREFVESQGNRVATVRYHYPLTDREFWDFSPRLLTAWAYATGFLEHLKKGTLGGEALDDKRLDFCSRAYAILESAVKELDSHESGFTGLEMYRGRRRKDYQLKKNK